MFITLFIMFIFMYGLGYATHKHINMLQKTNPEPPLLDTPEHVVNYLEACSLDQNNEGMIDLFKDFRSFADQKQLSGLSTVRDIPNWHHDPKAKIPCDQLWELFLTDLKREPNSAAKLEVMQHWMNDLKNKFTYPEMKMILDEFENSEDRAAARIIYASSLKELEKKK